MTENENNNKWRDIYKEVYKDDLNAELRYRDLVNNPILSSWDKRMLDYYKETWGISLAMDCAESRIKSRKEERKVVFASLLVLVSAPLLYGGIFSALDKSKNDKYSTFSAENINSLNEVRDKASEVCTDKNGAVEKIVFRPALRKVEIICRFPDKK